LAGKKKSQGRETNPKAETRGTRGGKIFNGGEATCWGPQRYIGG